MPKLTAIGFATQTITFSGVGTAADIVTVGGVTYTLRATVGATANEVLIGASANATAQNLWDAINATAAVSGTTFGSATTKNPQVKATGSGAAAGVVTVSARVAGSEFNNLPITKTSTAITLGGATLAGGTGNLGIALNEMRSEIQANSDIENGFEQINLSF